MRGEARRDDVRRSRRDGQRRRIGLHEDRVRDARAGQDAAPRGEHLPRRVDADRRRKRWRDPAERMAHAGTDVDEPLAAVLASERHDAVEILTPGMRRAVDISGRRAAELPLDRTDLAHSSASGFANSTVRSLR